MERNRWETAIRCLEIAVHPNTNNEEVIAAVNGFRRTANNAPLSQLCREFASAPADDVPPFTAEWKRTFDRLARENFELRQKVEEITDSRNAALRRLQEVEQQASTIGDELAALQHRADAAEQRLAALRNACERISGGLHHENFDLRRALTEARRDMAQPIHEPVRPIHEVMRPFQNVLNAALQRPNPAPAMTPAPVAAGPSWTA